MSRPEVKVCGIGRVEDARLAVRLGAKYLGFIVYPQSPRYISVDSLRELAETLPVSFRVVVDVAPTLEKLAEIRELEFDFYQIHFPMDQNRDAIAAWSEMVGRDRLWLAPKLPPEDQFPQWLFEYADTFLVDTYHKEGFGGSGLTGDWVKFKQLQSEYPDKHWILAGGLDPENIVKAVALAQPNRVDVNSGVEARPGQKSPEQLVAFFRNLNRIEG